jgi:hypothetical protein
MFVNVPVEYFLVYYETLTSQPYVVRYKTTRCSKVHHLVIVGMLSRSTVF